MAAMRASMLFILLVAAAAAGTAAAQSTCALTQRFNGRNRSFKTCQGLSQQGATLAWTHFQENRTLSAAFTSTAPSSSGWIGWGINITPTLGMVGSDVFIAFTANGTAHVEAYELTKDLMTALPSPAKSSSMQGVKLLSKEVHVSGNQMSILVTVELLRGGSATSIGHIWNRGPGMNGLMPLMHNPADDKSLGRIDLASGTASESALPHQKLKNRHGIINVVGWGVLLPLGVMSARYLKTFESADPAWFYIHAFCQSSGYVLGVVGWATGLKLSNYSSGSNDKHRNLGITIFAFATLQVLSLLLRPKKEHKIRKYWNVYHHSIGYATIAMIIVNIFEGFSLLQPARMWKNAYIGVISSLAGLSLILEVITWIVYLRRKSSKPAASKQPGMEGASLGLPQRADWNGA